MYLYFKKRKRITKSQVEQKVKYILVTSITKNNGINYWTCIFISLISVKKINCSTISTNILFLKSVHTSPNFNTHQHAT